MKTFPQQVTGSFRDTFQKWGLLGSPDEPYDVVSCLFTKL
jgi:hypothetical protein